MLDGKEISKEFDGGAGKFEVDVDAAGGVVVEVAYKKDVENGLVEVESSNKVKTNIFLLAEKITAKTGTTWDDKAIAMLKSALGIK